MLQRLHWLSMWIGVLALVIGVIPVSAQGPVEPQHSDPTWQASYWNNTTLNGTPTYQRTEINIAYDWGTASPVPGTINADNFSTRWTRYVDVTPGTYKFTVTSDDGVRVWVDNEIIIDQWTEHAAQTFTAEKYVGTGHHLIKVEYFEKGGLAAAKLEWSLKGTGPTPTPPVTLANWRAEYFNNITLGGTPVLVRDEAAISYNWGNGSPAPSVPVDRFSARWTGTPTMAAGMYHFTLTVDDGARVWVNGHLLIDAWVEQAARTYTGDLFVAGGPTTIEVQYYENGGLATAQFFWEPVGGHKPGAMVVVDNTDAGFTKSGPESGWRTVNEGYNGGMLWTYNNEKVPATYNAARWAPVLTPGRYEVFVYIPHRYTTTARARYTVGHSGGSTIKEIDQSAYSNQWVSLGTYTFSGNNTDYVTLADVTGEPYRSRLIGFDAVKWELR